MNSRRLLVIGGWTAYMSAITGALGLLSLLAMFVAFASGAADAGATFGRMNDVLVIVSYLLAMPTALALQRVIASYGALVSWVATVFGIAAMTAVVVLQWLLVAGTLTFDAQIGAVSVALLALAAWFVVIGFMGSSRGALPCGVRMGVLGASYVGYAAWAIWVGRRLLYLADKSPTAVRHAPSGA